VIELVMHGAEPRVHRDEGGNIHLLISDPASQIMVRLTWDGEKGPGELADLLKPSSIVKASSIPPRLRPVR
jgi:hypothetical protein